MTSIQAELKKQKANLKLYTGKDDDKSVDIFSNQKESLEKITWTEWFKHIQMFWIAREMNAMQDFENADLDDKTKLCEIRARFKLAKEFNAYLNVRLQTR